MCGILAALGCIDVSQAKRARILELSRRLRHRGPDWSGISHHGNCFLAHQRLAIVDPTSGNQPLYNEDRTIVVTVNGEIYNHEELRKKLGSHKFRTRSDCEVIAHLYEAYGEDFVNMLDGMFSFVLVDTRDNSFIAARDAIGITPLYTGWGLDGSIWFASEMKALNDDCERFECFPPGHIYSSKLGGYKRWYNPPWYSEDIPSTPYDPLVLREAFEKAVLKRLMADVPFGVLLSGGLDSSLVAAVASRYLAGTEVARQWGAKLHTFCIGLQGSPDLKAAKEVADYLGSFHHEFDFTVQEGIDAIEEVIYHVETYTQDTSPSVLLFFDQQRFIFNAGEGLQRFSAEHKFKLSRLDHIFLTRVCSETAGGIPGLLLTMAGIGDDGMTVNIWGPSDLEYLTGAMRSFIPNSAVVHTNSFGPGHVSEERTVNHNSNGSISTNPIILVKDEIVQISAVVLLPNAVGSCGDLENSIKISKEANSKDEEESTNLAQKHPRLASERSSETEETNSGIQARYKPGDIAVVYICELPDINGKFDPSKAQALGLKPGPKYRELQLGNSVMSDSGNAMVHPSDVMGPSSPGPIVLLVDCPTISHLPDLLSAPAFNNFFPGADNESENLQKHVNCVVHLTPASVTKYPDYVQWMSKFGDAQHIMAGHEEKNMEFPILKSSARISTRLNFLCPQLFPVPGFRSLNVGNNSERASAQMSQVHGSIPAANLLKFRLRPYARLGLDQSSVPSLPTASDIIDDLVSEIPEIVDASKQIAQLWIPVLKGQCGRTQPIETPNSPSTMLEEPWLQNGPCKSELESENKIIYDSSTGTQLRSPNELECCNRSDEIPVCLEGINRDVMEMVFLGTGSSQPSKYRNVSAIFINLFSQGGILLDCGEGTLAQLKRRFGVRGADDVIKSLKFIWISHIHADHHTGLARILSLRKQLLKNEPHESLLVIGPRPLRRFLDAYSRVEDLGMQFMDCRQTVKESMDAYEQISCDTDDHMRSNKDHIEGSGDASGQLFKKEMSVGSNLVWFKPENKLEALNVGQNRMQSYWQRPDGSGLDITGLQMLKKALSEAGLEILTSVPVVHCPQAFGVVLQAASRKNSANKTVPGWKLVYSGDTRPCQALIDAACGATVLIHEATFDDSMPEEAVSKNHSLTKEAIEVGASAGAYRIILTHFSQRYPKIPVFDESFMDRTCIAFDLMTVNLADLPFVPKINPFLKLLFKNEMAAEEGFESEKTTEDVNVEL